MYKTNLSYGMLQVCLEQLLKQELLELNLSAKNYSTTEKGLDFLQTWTTLQQFTITPWEVPLQKFPPLSMLHRILAISKP
jgi:hypothetical protein